MDVIEAIKKRKSIRAYQPDPVSKEILMEILEVGMRAPSAKNIQPWGITVICGALLDNIRIGNVEALMAGRMPEMEVEIDPTNVGEFKDREVALGKEIFRIMEIGREDKEKRLEWIKRGFRFFDAPTTILLSADKSVDHVRAASDIGGFAQSICLAALKHQLGTCINRQGILYPDVVRKFVDIPKSQLVYICVTIGYPDWDFPVNNMETQRASIESKVSWYGL